MYSGHSFPSLISPPRFFQLPNSFNSMIFFFSLLRKQIGKQNKQTRIKQSEPINKKKLRKSTGNTHTHSPKKKKAHKNSKPEAIMYSKGPVRFKKCSNKAICQICQIRTKVPPKYL